MKIKITLLTLIAAGALSQFGTPDTSANTLEVEPFKTSVVPNSQPIHQFKPRPSSRTKFDYSVWDSLIESMVLYTGPSTRRRASKPRPVTGTRMVHAHTSALRMEGNKIPFEKFERKFETVIQDYRIDLESLGNEIDIPSLSRNEQLAYWLNLHNVVLVEQLAANYPVKTPSQMKVGPAKAKLHDAKIINIDGVPLSLRDIRERIVYPNWKNPVVIYGFFLGDIGSPTMQNYAFNGSNVYRLLGLGAVEFTNSLRGFEKGKVSKIYGDLSSYYFSNFETDLRVHLNKYMRPTIRQELASAPILKIARYESTIADLTGGHGDRKSLSPLRVSKTSPSSSGAGAFDNYVKDLYKKRRTLEKQGFDLRGTVTIEDVLPEEVDISESDTSE